MFEFLGSFKSIADLPIHFRWMMWGVSVLLLTVALFGKELGLVGGDATASRSINDQSVNAPGDGAISAPVQGSHNGDTAVTQNVTSKPREIRIMSLWNSGEIKVHLDNQETLSPESLGVIQQEYTVSAGDNNSAKFKAYIIYDNAAWAIGRADRFVRHHNGQYVDLDDFLSSPKFARDAQSFVAIVCLGTASGYMEDSPIKSFKLSDKRAVNLCGEVSERTQFISKDTWVIGVPLGHHTDTSVGKDTKAERKQRALIIIGVSDLSGSFATNEGVQEFITGLILKDGLNGFETSGYSQAQTGEPLHFLKVSRNVFN